MRRTTIYAEETVIELQKQAVYVHHNPSEAMQIEQKSGYRCKSCGREYCKDCLEKKAPGNAYGGKSCPNCGGLFENIHDFVTSEPLAGATPASQVRTSSHRSSEADAALIVAANQGHGEIVESLLAKGAHANAQDEKGCTALMYAARNGHTSIVESLLAKGADVNAQNEKGSTAIMFAARNGHTAIAESLLARGADVNVHATNNGTTALILAAGNGHSEVVASLLANGAEVNSGDGDGDSALILAAKKGYKEIVDSLLASGAAVNAQNKEGNTALIEAAWSGHSEIVESLLAKGAKVSAQNKEGNTALILAAWSGHSEIVESLLAKGAKVSAQNKEGNTALILAAWSGHSEIVESLLAKGAEVSAQNEKGNTALILAAGDEPHLEVVEKVLAAGADVNALNHNGTSALMIAAWWGHKAIVDRLLAGGADVSICDKDGDTAQKVAARNRHEDVVRSLKARPARASMPPASAFEARAWMPTHLVPSGGMAAWDAPDPSRPPMVQLSERLELVVEAGAGAWAQARAINGWRGWVDGRLLVLNTAAGAPGRIGDPGAVGRPQPVEQSRNGASAPKEAPTTLLTGGLRPLGNKKRLTQAGGENSYDVRLILFRDRTSAEEYYDLLIGHARRTPPPFVIEMLLVFMPVSIFAEKYAAAIPNENSETRPGYEAWARDAMRTCNDTLRMHSSTDHKYKDLHRYVEVVYKWDILVPKGFSATSSAAKELLCDDPNEAFPPLKVLGQEGVAAPPEKPSPQGPWIGVLFEISRFDEALYGRAATKRLFEIVGGQQLAGCVIHGGDVPPECRHWCLAVHTPSAQQARLIEQAVLASSEEHLAPGDSRLLAGAEVPGELTYQGFVSGAGTYVGK
jgi:ankyrin repeat protein